MTPEQEAEYQWYCDTLPETFRIMVLSDELSREPTKAEIALMLPILRKKLETGDWNQTEQEIVHFLCSVTDITTTLELP